MQEGEIEMKAVAWNEEKREWIDLKIKEDF